MKFVPFVEDIKPSDQQLMHRWFWRSVFLISCLVVSVAAFSIQQYVGYSAIKREHTQLKSTTAQLHACLEQKRQLKEQAEQLHGRLTKMNRIKNRPKNPSDILATLSTLATDVVVQDITVKKKKIDLVLFARDVHILLNLVDQLRANELFATVDLAAIEQVSDRFKAVVHGMLR